jgi:hypothetical protein
MFGTTGAPNAAPATPARTVSKERDDPLRLGGQLYLRLQASSQEDSKPGDVGLASPNLLDVYLDVRPNGGCARSPWHGWPTPPWSRHASSEWSWTPRWRRRSG